MDYRHPRTCTMYNLNTLSVTIHKPPTIHIDESVKMENAWVEALSLIAEISMPNLYIVLRIIFSSSKSIETFEQRRSTLNNNLSIKHAIVLFMGSQAYNDACFFGHHPWRIQRERIGTSKASSKYSATL
nr:hypothetical protein Iba_chr12cCG10040 [Ipomoea batatas]